MPEEAAAMQATQTVTLSTQELQEPKQKDDQKGSEDGSQLVRALGFFVTRQAKTIDDYNHSGSCWTKKWVSDEQGSIERGIWQASSIVNRLSRKSETYKRAVFASVLIIQL